jgi:RHS repeat-associated protein
VRGVGKTVQTRRRLVVVVLVLALVSAGGAVATGGPGGSLSGLANWLRSLFAEDIGPTTPEVASATTADADTDELGLENFYQYAGGSSGAGSQTMVNLHTGNAVFAYRAFVNPSLGHSTFVRITYNSLDRDDSSMGLGWSVSATTLNRLGTPLDFHPPGQSWPREVTLVDGDGTSHVFRLNDHDSKDPTKWEYDQPAGVHLYLQKNTGGDASRAWVMTKPDRTRFFFDDDGYQTAIADANGNELRFGYAQRKSQKKPTKFLQDITDPAGRRTLIVTYYAKGDTYPLIDDSGNRVMQDDLTDPHIIDNIKTITDVDGRRIEFAYTDKGLLGEVVDGAGTPLAKSFRFGYNVMQATPNTRLARITDPRGNSTGLDYFDAPSNPKFKGWVRSITDRLGAVTSFEYVDPDGPRASSLQATVTDPLSHATKYALDGRGRPVNLTDAKENVTQLGWDSDDNLVRIKEPNGAQTTFVYDAKTGYPREVGDAEANAHRTPPTKLTYRTTLNGHIAELATSTSPQGRTWTYDYDSRGNLVSATDPAGNASPAAGDFTTHYAYDSAGQLVSQTDANGHTTTFGDYDPNGLPRSITDPLGHATVMAYNARGGVVSLTDARGKTSTFGFDLFGRRLDSRVPKKAAAAEYLTTAAPVYDANDNITESTAANGAKSTANYDAGDRLTTALVPKDTPEGPLRRNSYTYDQVGNLLSVTEPNGNLTDAPDDFVTRYRYDEIYQITRATDAVGGVTSYGYDNVGNVVLVVDPRKNATADPADFSTKFAYDLNHRITRTTDAAGNAESIDYDRDGLTVGSTDKEGNKTLFAYDARGLRTETKVPYDTVDGVITYHTTRYEYDQVGNQTKTVSPRGVATEDDPDDFAAVSVYDELNRVTERRLPFDKDDPTYTVADTVRYTYDEVGNLVKVSQPTSGKIPGADGPRVETEYSYFDNGWIASSIDPFGIVTSYDYNALGRQTRRTITGADGGLAHTSAWSYYPDGKLSGKTDDGVPAGSEVLLWDNSDRALTFAGGPVEWTTSSAGTGFFGTDYATHAAGTGQNTFTWQAPQRKQDGDYEVFVRYPAVAGAATNATYQLFGQTRTVDQTQHAGEWVSLGKYHVIAATEFDQVKLTDAANGIVVADAVKFVRDTGGVVDNEFQSFSYTYDANGNLTSVNDASSGPHIDAYAMSYTGLNQLSKMEEKAAGAVQHTSTYEYDLNGNLTSRTLDSLIDVFEYDARDLVTKVTNFAQPGDVAAKVTTYDYTPRGQVSRQRKSLASTVDYTYYADGSWRHTVEHGETGTLVAEHSLEYDLNGNLAKDVARLMHADISTAYLDRTLTYEYDPRDRVTKVNKGTTAEDYLYDANGNILREILTQQGGNQFAVLNSYDRNRLVFSFTKTPHADGSFTGTNSDYYHDPFGRLTLISSASADSPGKAEIRSVGIRYDYDGFDRKVEEDVVNLPFSAVTKYTYDTFNRVIADTRQTYAFTQDGTVPKIHTDSGYRYLGTSDLVLTDERSVESNRTTTRYRYSANGERLSQHSATNDGTPSGEFNYIYNSRGDVEAITGPGGNTRATYGFTAYGQDDELMFTGVDRPDPSDQFKTKRPVNIYRFNARTWDQASGTYDMGFRDYSPNTGRFLTPDHYTGAQADLWLNTTPATANQYAFAAGNPINNIDIDGHAPVPGPGIQWIDYYLSRIGQGSSPGARQAIFASLGPKQMRGEAAVYDRGGNLTHYDPTFFTGKKLAEEGNGFETHIEARVRTHLNRLGYLEEGSTIVITLEKSKPVCEENCVPKLEKVAREKGVRIIVRAPGRAEQVFGEGNSGAALEGGGIEPAQTSLFEEPTIPRAGGAGRTGSVRGGGTPRGLGGAGEALGVIGFLADLYFYWRYGPCGTGYLPESYCRSPNDPRYWA